MILPQQFYEQEEVTIIARALIGKVLVSRAEGVLTSGMIVETEAYAGVTDKASHAFGHRRTARTSIMYAHGGVAYVYLCYGIHHLFNVVTNVRDVPHAVLIRAVSPLEGVEIMLRRRQKNKLSPTLTAGPGALSSALGIRTFHTGTSLQGPELCIEDRGFVIADADLCTGTRVGVAYAGEDAFRPYRFWLKNNPFVSKAKGL